MYRAFFLPYSILSSLLNQENNILKLKSMMEGSIFQINDFQHYLNADWTLLVILLAIGLICCSLMIELWSYTLNKIDLLPYTYNHTNFKPSYKVTPFYKKRNAFYVKDFLYLTRLNEWWWEHLGRTFIVLSILSGIAIPVIKVFLDTSSLLFVYSISVLFSILTYQILGDSLRILLAIDREAKNMHLFIHRKFTLWEIVVEKLKIYHRFVNDCHIINWIDISVSNTDESIETSSCYCYFI